MKDCSYTVTANGQELVFTYDGLRGYLLDMANLQTLAPAFAAQNAQKLNITGAVERPTPAITTPQSVTPSEAPSQDVASTEPLRYDSQTDRHNGRKLTRGDILVDGKGQRYILDRNMGFTLNILQLNDQNRFINEFAISVDPLDSTRYMSVYFTGKNLYDETIRPEQATPTVELKQAKPKKSPAPTQNEKVTEGNLQRVFNLTTAQAKAVLSLWKAMGIPIGRLRLRKGTTAPAGKDSQTLTVIAQMDAEYMAAVKAGNTAKAQEMVNSAAKAAGYASERVQHTSLSGIPGRFTAFVYGAMPGGLERFKASAAKNRLVLTLEGLSPGWFTTNFNQFASSREEGDANVYRAFLQFNNPLIISATEAEQSDMLATKRAYIAKSAQLDAVRGTPKEYSAQTDRLRKEISKLESQIKQEAQLGQSINEPFNRLVLMAKEAQNNNPDLLEGAALRESLLKQGYDGVVLQNTNADTKRTDVTLANWYIPLKGESQIKSADPVTYDDNGDVIPLSKRFTPITPDIRYQETLGATTPLPSEASATVNGFIEFLNSDQRVLAKGALAIIQGFEGGNLSTAVHEAFHFYRRFLMNTANGFEQSELDQFAEWAGVKDGQWTVEAEEKAARAFEKYLYEGATPQGATHRLLQLFAKIAEWMKEVYKTLSGSEIDVAIPDNIRKTFDKIFVQGELYKDQPMILMDNGQVIAGLRQVAEMNPTTFERFKRAGQTLTSFLKQVGNKGIGKYTRSERAELDRHLGAVERAAGITPTRLYQDNRTNEKRVQEAEELINSAPSPEAAKAAREKRLAEMQAARAAFLRGEITSAEMQDRTVPARPAKQPLTTEEKVKTRKESTKEAFGGQTIKEYAEGMVEQARRGDLSGRTPPVAKRVEGDIRSVLRRAALALNDNRMDQGEFDDLVRQAEKLFDMFKSGTDRDSDTYKKAKADIWRTLSQFAPPRTQSASRQKRRGFGDRTITEVLQSLIEKARRGDPPEERELTDRETAESRIMRGLNKAVLAETVDGTAPAGTINEMLRLGQQWLDVMGSQDAEAVQMAEELFRQAAQTIKVDPARKRKPTKKARKALEVVFEKVRFEVRQESQQKNIPRAAKDLAEIEQDKTERAVERWLKRYEEATQKGLLTPTMDNVFTGEAGVDRKTVLMAALEAYREARDHGDVEAQIYAERIIRDAINVPRTSDIYADMTSAERIKAKFKRASQINEFRTPLSVLNIIGAYERQAGAYGAQISTVFHTIHARLARNQYLGMTEAIKALKESLGLTYDYKIADDGYLRIVEEAGYAGIVEAVTDHVRRIEANYQKRLKMSRKWQVVLTDGTAYTSPGEDRPRVFPSQPAAEAFRRRLSNAIPTLKDAKVKPQFGRLENLFDEISTVGAVEAVARISKAYVYQANLRFNVKSTALNYVTLALTIWPHVTTKEFAQIMKQAATDPEDVTTTALREAGGFYDVPGSEREVELGETRRQDLFAKSNQFARIAGHYTGLMLARRAKMGPEARDVYVKQWTERVEFDNSQWNAIPAISGDIASWLLQFKPFLIKNFERVWADMARPVPYSHQTAAVRRGKLLFAMFAAGGLNTILSVVPGVRPIMGPLLLGGLAFALAAAGMNDDDAEELAQLAMYGLPSVFGADLAGSMLFTDELIGNSLLEQVSNFILGPSINKYVKNLTLGGKVMNELLNERSLAEPQFWDRKMDKAFWKFAQSVTPLARQLEAGQKAVGAATGKTEKPVMQLGKEERPLTAQETIVRTLGGTPVKQSVFYEKQAMRESSVTGFLAEKLIGTPRTIEGLPRQTGETDQQYSQRRELQRIWLGTYGEQLRQSPQFQNLPSEDRKQIEENFKSRVVEQTKALPSKRRLKSLTPSDVLGDYFRSQKRKQRETPVPQRPK